MQKSHSQNTFEVIQAAFPLSLAEDLIEVMKVIPVTDSEPHADLCKAYMDGCEISIPSRVYFPEIYPQQCKNLTDTQKTILAAIFTRHHSGYQREIWAEQLASYPSVWSAPFAALLLGDYVQEVLTAFERNIDGDWTQFIQSFAVMNPEWRRPLNHRILNYWAIYYRSQIPLLTEYAGYTLAVRLGLWDKKTAPKLMRMTDAKRKH